MWWDELGAGGDARAAGRRQRAGRARAARQHARRRRDLDDLPGRREGDAIVVDGAFDAFAHPGWAAGAFTPQSRASQRVAPRRRPAAGRARARPVRRARRQDDAPRRAHGRRRRGRRRRAPRRPRRARCGAPASAMHATNVARGRAPTRATVPRRPRLRPRAARPAVQRPGHAAARTPTCAGARRPSAIARLAAEQDALLAAARARAATRRSAALVYSVCTISPRRGAPARRRRGGGRCPTATAPTASILPVMEAERRARSARRAASPGCGPSNLPGRYRCVYCLHRFELRSVCPDCGEHSTIVRMSSTATTDVQPLRRLDARRGMTRRVAPSILAADFGRLREQVQEVRRRRRRRSSTSTSWTATSCRRSRWAPQAVRGAARSRRAPRRPPHDRAPRAPRRGLRQRRRGHDHRARRGDARTSTTRWPPSARPAAAPGSPSTRARRSAVFGEVECDQALCMTVNPGWGGQAFIPRSLDGSSACGRSIGDGVELEVDGGIDLRHRAPVRRGGGDAVRGRYGGLRSGRPGDGLRRADRRGRRMTAGG